MSLVANGLQTKNTKPLLRGLTWLGLIRIVTVFSALFSALTRKESNKTLQTKERREAERCCSRVEENLLLVKRGLLTVPSDADIATFLLTDGRVGHQAETAPKVTLSELFEQYLNSLPTGAVEETSLKTGKIHIKHHKRLIGRRFDIRCLKLQTLQKYINSRSKEEGHREKRISPTTIRKELTIFSGAWSWARQNELVDFDFPKKGLRYPKTGDKPPFQTWKEIESQIERGNLTEMESDELWDCLYLTRSEIEELLLFASEAARHEFIAPMVTMAAHTGARRSELVRSELTDIDLENRVVRIRERKRAKGRHTFRSIPMSRQLQVAMESWMENHPGGRYTFCMSQSHSASRNRNQLSVDQAHDHLKRTLRGTWSNVRGWHVFRHSFISNCAAHGIDQRMIDAWSGHQTDEMRRRYTHLFPDQQEAAMDSVFGVEMV